MIAYEELAQALEAHKQGGEPPGLAASAVAAAAPAADPYSAEDPYGDVAAQDYQEVGGYQEVSDYEEVDAGQVAEEHSVDPDQVVEYEDVDYDAHVIDEQSDDAVMTSAPEGLAAAETQLEAEEALRSQPTEVGDDSGAIEVSDAEVLDEAGVEDPERQQ